MSREDEDSSHGSSIDVTVNDDRHMNQHGNGSSDGEGRGVHPVPWRAVDYGAFTTDDRDVSLDENAPSMLDAVTADTSFNPSDGGSDVEYWQWLSELNDGRGASDRSVQIHDAGVQRDIDVVCDLLHCTSHQRDRVEWLLRNMDIDGVVLPSGPIEIVVIAAVTVVVDEDRSRYARQDSDVTSVVRDDEFKEVVDAFGVSRRRVKRCRGRVRSSDVYQSPNS